MLDIGIENATAFRMAGKVTENDVALVLSDMKAKVTAFGTIVVYMELESFAGIGFAAVIEELKYLFDVGISGVTKAVLVTDKRWMEHLVKVEDTLFRHIGMQYFPMDEKASAIGFLKG
jgi:hypothetical protein